ncbi:uncharacterized protein G2W53_027250 [Senna tora]|uniref:Uncharacterized protein n=1 Tax=Senna tora TaxID=362788 RepID=A0A834WFW5_9FABA|nr:uncharacterized protein G2W53_027250 [Senna tora]
MARTSFFHSSSRRNLATLWGMARLPTLFPFPLILGFRNKIALWVLAHIFLRLLPIVLGEGVSADSLSARVCSAECHFSTAASFIQESRAFLDNALRFRLCVAHHPFPMPLLGHDGGGQFVCIIAMAGVHPFWLRGDLRPLFPLCWLDFRSPMLVPLSALSESERAAVTNLSTQPPRNMGDLCVSCTYVQWKAEQRQTVVMSSSKGSPNWFGDVAPPRLDSFRSMPSAGGQASSVISGAHVHFLVKG